MPALRSRNTVVLAKVESTEGVDASPVAGTDAVLVENPRISFNPNVIDTNESSSSLDDFGAIVGGMTVKIDFDVYVRGATAPWSTAPDFGKLIKACGFTETLTATAVPVAPEACAAGGSTTTAVLGASASTTAQLYRGMPIVFTGAVAGTSFITDYTAGKVATLTDTLGGSIIATSNYQIPTNALYTPASSSIPSLTFYLYTDGVLYKVLGARGTFQLNLTSGGPAKMSFTFMGIFSSKTDTAVPTATYDATRPPIWKNGLSLINRLSAATASLGLDINNQMTNPDDPNQLEGYAPAVITRRNPKGSVNPLETLVATRDIMSAFRAGTKQIIHARYGATTGNRVGLTIPQGLYLNQNPTDRNGLIAVDVPFEAVGQDSGLALCFY